MTAIVWVLLVIGPSYWSTPSTPSFSIGHIASEQACIDLGERLTRVGPGVKRFVCVPYEGRI